MADESKKVDPGKVEILPPQPVNLEQIIAAAQPLVETWSKAEIEKLRIEVDAEKKSSEGEWQDFTLICIALVAFLIALGWGIYRDNVALVQSALVGLGTFFGGLGLGKASARHTRLTD
jgi:hypothetical protein